MLDYLYVDVRYAISRTIFELYIVELENLAITLLGFMGKEMKMEKKEIEEMFRDGMQAMRMTYYPPCPQPELVMGLSAHSDACGITILNQLNGVDGLQIKKDGVWIPIKVSKDALVINIGDVLEVCDHPLLLTFFQVNIFFNGLAPDNSGRDLSH